MKTKHLYKWFLWKCGSDFPTFLPYKHPNGYHCFVPRWVKPRPDAAWEREKHPHLLTFTSEIASRELYYCFFCFLPTAFSYIPSTKRGELRHLATRVGGSPWLSPTDCTAHAHTGSEELPRVIFQGLRDITESSTSRTSCDPRFLLPRPTRPMFCVPSLVPGSPGCPHQSRFQGESVEELCQPAVGQLDHQSSHGGSLHPTQSPIQHKPSFLREIMLLQK